MPGLVLVKSNSGSTLGRSAPRAREVQTPGLAAHLYTLWEPARDAQGRSP